MRLPLPPPSDPQERADLDMFIGITPVKPSKKTARAG